MIDLHPDLELTPEEAERILEAWLGGPVRCSEIRRLQGGLVNSVFRLEFDRSPHRAVVKLHGREGDPFSEEARALEYLRARTACPVPDVHLHDNSGRLVAHACLLLEYIPGVCLETLDLGATERADVDTQLADILGDLHTHTGTNWGRVDVDEGYSTWSDLVVARLVDVRARPAVAERLAPEVLTRVDDAIGLTPTVLRGSGPPTLVHGDVWDGNVMVRHEDGRLRVAGLLDPDLRFADPELELAYLEVFDTRREAFFDAYAQHHEVHAGYERRRLFYWLHTALVHVALFGDEFFCEFTARTAEQIGELAPT